MPGITTSKLDRLVRYIQDRNSAKARWLLERLQRRTDERQVLDYRYHTDETLLHIAAKYQDDGELTSRILQIAPNLILKARSCEQYAGQTAFHIAITKGNLTAFNQMLNVAARSPQSLRTLLSTRATGRLFVNTVMMGELPLFVAVLKFDKDMVDKLLDIGAKLYQQNSKGDTIFHSLIKYAAVYPDKACEVREMMEYLHDRLVQFTKAIVEKQAHAKKKVQTDEEEEEEDDEEEEENKEDNEVKPIGNGYHHDMASTRNFPPLDMKKTKVAWDAPKKKEKEGKWEETVCNEYTHVWFLKNDDSQTSLQLAAEYGMVTLFEFILNIEDIYCVFSADDGLFDIKLYDITEIDSIGNTQSQTMSVDDDDIDGRGCCRGSNGSITTVSILEMMFDNNYKSSSAFELMELLPLKVLIEAKWNLYKNTYIFWMVVHFFLMIVLSVYAVERTSLHFPKFPRAANSTATKNLVSVWIVNVSQWVEFIFGIIYFLIGVLLIFPKVKRPHRSRYWQHNIGYITMVLMFAVCLLLDSLLTFALEVHDGVPLVFALLTGWWFNVFFLRGWQVFSFFTVMIQRVIFGDLFRFSVFIGLELVAFTTCMHTVYQGQGIPNVEGIYSSTEVSTLLEFGSTMLSMFNLMLGLSNIGGLRDARVPWLSIILFIAFVLLTYVLLLNALIAMMSATCGTVLENRYEQWRIQQLSVILFIEDLLCLFCMNRILRCPAKSTKMEIFHPSKMTTKTHIRYYLKMQSLQGDFASEEDTEIIQKKTQAEIANTVNTELLQSIKKESKFMVPKKEERKPHSCLKGDRDR
ncbi:transient receptor potential cation channel subfamily V member 5-like [Pecten maximus]|uniref:transient receptor potential cation channel subfamily V member 5-like n=1 Tax=Pecten maximus TaxID=6579 RepID=UPI001458BD03|nr:transient receptor potential cation channel subfamily V member 5-like [Pecten maximus]